MDEVRRTSFGRGGSASRAVGVVSFPQVLKPRLKRGGEQWGFSNSSVDRAPALASRFSGYHQPQNSHPVPSFDLSVALLLAAALHLSSETCLPSAREAVRFSCALLQRLMGIWGSIWRPVN